MGSSTWAGKATERELARIESHGRYTMGFSPILLSMFATTAITLYA
jgi:hypothetical protein